MNAHNEYTNELMIRVGALNSISCRTTYPGTVLEPVVTANRLQTAKEYA